MKKETCCEKILIHVELIMLFQSIKINNTVTQQSLKNFHCDAQCTLQKALLDLAIQQGFSCRQYSLKADKC